MKNWTTFPLVLALVFGCARAELPEQKTEMTPVRSDVVPEQTQAPAHAVIRVTPELAERIEAGESVDGIPTMRRVFPDGGEYEERARKAGLHLFYEIDIDPEMPRTKAEGVLEAVPGVEEIEFDRPIKLRTFNDPNFSQQWHYYNPGTKAGYKAGADINVQKVWDEIGTGNASVIVNVVMPASC